MAGTSMAGLIRQAREARAAGRPAEALAAVHSAYAQETTDARVRRLAASLLMEAPNVARPEHADMLLDLVRDSTIEPQALAEAGWLAALCHIPAEATGRTLAEAIERDELALALLEETPVLGPGAELRLTGLRRWLLIANAWPDFPRLTTALIAQALLNGGAWWFDDEERTLLASPDCAPLAQAFLPRRVGDSRQGSGDAGGTSGAVTRQYERWPYPRWRRITMPTVQRLPDVVAELDADFRADTPVAAEILVAGCGTGRHAAYVASTFPDARVTGIDVSGASLDYARRACRALGIANVSFAQLDLMRVAELGTRFHAIYCAGVLHHLEDPEAGWAALANVLRPGGVMRLALYSKVARMGVAAARRRLADLAALPTDDDVIRLARRRLLEAPDDAPARWMTRSRDFATLEGACDLLLHPHEDPFTQIRIGRALEATGMRLLRLQFPSPAIARQYETMFPGDASHRDLANWAAFEKQRPGSFARMYDFWCGKPA